MRKRDIDFGNKFFLNLNVASGITKEIKIEELFDNIKAFKVVKDNLFLTCIVTSKDKKTELNVELKAGSKADSFALYELEKVQDRAFLKAIKVNNDHAFFCVRSFSNRNEYINEAFIISLTQDFVLQARNTAKKDFHDIISFMEQEFLLDSTQIFIHPSSHTDKPDIMIGKSYTCELLLNRETNTIIASNIKRKRKNQIENIRHINIISGKISFIDGLKKIKDAARKIFDENESVNSEFEKIWLAYNEAYLEESRDEVDRVGCFEYKLVSYSYPMRFHLKKPFNPYSSRAFLESDLGYAIVSKSDFDSITETNGKIESLSDKLDAMMKANLKMSFFADKIDWNEKDNSIIPRSEPNDIDLFPAQGYIVASYSGSKTMKDRREKAYARIQQMENPMPSLRNIIAMGKSDQLFPLKHRAPVNDKLIRKIFGKTGNRFTECQREAIDIAINTPDVAIIQGPPGTGKTTIIRAIVERLNELYPEDLRILISSTQHDAVDNAIRGMTCSGMPAIRTGGRFNDEAKYQRYKAEWIKKLEKCCDEILKDEPENRNRLKHRHIYNLIETIRKQSIENINANRERIKELHQLLREIGYEEGKLTKLTEITNKFIDAKYEQIEAVEHGNEYQVLLNNQRLDRDEFLTDGRSYLIQLITNIGLDNKVNFNIPEYWNTVRRASSRRIPDGFDEAFKLFVNDIKHLKESINQSSVSENQLLIRKEVEDLLDNIKAYVDAQAEHERTIYDVIWDFRDKIGNPGNIDRVLQRYSKVKAATCQQSVVNQVSTGNLSRLGNDRAYHYVIIDEAARSNPLDLIIPMSLGQHVILVGDQKQLPHMLESDVLSKTLARYDKNLRDEKENLLKESLFQRLYRQLNMLTNGKRVTMLREQYRMHPTIGKFISECFYDGKLISEVSEKDREHNTNLFDNKPVAWIDVPIDLGMEKTDGFSYCRQSEIKEIMKLVDIIGQKNKDFTIGIITFYKAQEKLLKTALDNLPDSISIRTDVGTVDAFQGKEFDIVFLSTVRSNDYKESKRSVGFLDNENRLNVAFSRAKRLLVCVGDHETVAKKNGEEQIRSFARFYELCREVGFYE